MQKNLAGASKSRSVTFVPTSHPFEGVIREFIQLRRTGHSLSEEDFLESMFKTESLKLSTRKSYLFPLKKNEFNLFDCSKESIEELAGDSLRWLRKRFEPDGFHAFLDRRHVCLKDAWLVGYLNRHFSETRPFEILIDSGFAGSENAASALMTVGRSVGIFFSLLDQNGFPTENFDDFFRHMKDLERELPERPRLE